MDTFFEQIVPVKKTANQIFAVIGIWLLAVLISILAVFLLGLDILATITLFIIFGAFYGAYKLSGRFNLEYEYILTNGTFDVDKIMSKSSRKRLLTFELSSVTRLEKFNPVREETGNFETKIIACDKSDENAYTLVASKQGGGNIYLVLAPDERMRQAMIKFIPRHISNSVFK
ncbi:MAG: hypothetical protein II802_02020 [Clostridia bacterium]|nr:hypothetical protein [Clostridia bacterium]